MVEITTNSFSEHCYLKHKTRIDVVIVYPTARDLWSQLPLTLIILISRYILEKYLFSPLGRWLIVNDVNAISTPNNIVLERTYNSSKWKDLSSLAKKADLKHTQVEQCWHLRHTQDRPSTLAMFTENTRKACFALFNFVFGLYTLWDKEWFWDIEKTTDVNMGVTADVWWYYMVSSGFYWSLTVTHFWDVRHKDYWQMFLHHFTANALLTLSWLANAQRIGCVILLLHEITDIPLEIGKAAKIAGLQRGVTPLFALFVASWILSRLILYPYLILTRTTAQAYACNLVIVHALNLLLWFLFGLHLVWTWMLYQVVVRAVSGQELEDIRSCSSQSDLSLKNQTVY